MIRFSFCGRLLHRVTGARLFSKVFRLSNLGGGERRGNRAAVMPPCETADEVKPMLETIGRLYCRIFHREEYWPISNYAICKTCHRMRKVLA